MWGGRSGAAALVNAGHKNPKHRATYQTSRTNTKRITRPKTQNIKYSLAASAACARALHSIASRTRRGGCCCCGDRGGCLARQPRRGDDQGTPESPQVKRRAHHFRPIVLVFAPQCWGKSALSDTDINYTQLLHMLKAYRR